MGFGPLCLLLLLASCTLAQDVEEAASCQIASRFKVKRKYAYRYSAESRNEASGTANLHSGPKVTCLVEVEVPQMCRFIVHTRDCTVSEATAMDPQGKVIYGPAPGTDAFKASMEKSPLRVSVHSNSRVEIYPAADEPVNILNIKRGIISAFLVPVMEDGQTSLVSSVHGQCLTEVTVDSREDIATDASLSRDLSQCDQFHRRKLHSSPFALLQHLHYPLSKLITSTQTCRYQFDNRGTHITTAKCTEKHRYLPFSNGENGILSVVNQDLNFQSVKLISSRKYDAKLQEAKPLHFEEPEEKTPVQTKDAVLSTFQALVALKQHKERSGLFHRLVSSLRVLSNETISQAAAEMVRVSYWLTFQALFQCGTSECTSAIMQVFWTADEVSLEMDALVYALSLHASPTLTRVRDMLSMAQRKQSKAIMYALANTVKRIHKGEVTPEITEVSKFMHMILNDCSEEIRDSNREPPPDRKEEAFLVLRVVGVMGQAMQDASPSLVSSILRCMKKADAPLANQKAAIQALRLMDITPEIRSSLLEVYQGPQSPSEKRLAAYLTLMKKPDHALIREISDGLMEQREEQLKSFVLSHLYNIQNSDDVKPELRELIKAALQDKPLPTMFNGLSKHYQLSSPLGSVQSHVVFDDQNTLPKEMTASLKAFNHIDDILEVGIDGGGFEPTVKAFFGEKSLFPESFSRFMEFVGNRAPMLRDVLGRISAGLGRKGRQIPDDHLKAIRDNVQQLLREVRLSAAPEATAFLRLLGDEIGYMKMNEMRKMLETLSTYFHVVISALPAQALVKLATSAKNGMFLHYVFMETSFSLPTASGFPLKFSLSGVFAPGARGGLTPSAVTDVYFEPSVGLEFITQMGVHLPDYVDSGTEVHTNLYHESSFRAKVTVKKNQVKLSIPAPSSNHLLLSVSNKLLSISSGQTKPLPSLMDNRVNHTDCRPVFTWLDLCTVIGYSSGSSMEQTPYLALTRDAAFTVKLQPTGKFSEYTATIADETLRESRRSAHKVESLKLTLRAEGEEPMEATASVKYNRNRNSFSTELVIPDCDVEAAINLAVTKTDADGRKMRGFTIDVTNNNIPWLTIAGHARHEMGKEVKLQLQLKIPAVKMNASITAILKKEENVLMDLDSVVQLPGTSYQQKASLKYDDDRIQVNLKTDLTAEIKKLIPDAEDCHRKLQKLIGDILDQKVAKTDMKLRHIVTKGIEAGNNWLDKLTAKFPSLSNFRSKRSVSDLTLPPLPEKLFLHLDGLFRYQFNKEKTVIHLPLPFGGKTSEELNLPKTLSIPLIDLQHISLYIPAKKYVLPAFSIPTSLALTIPLLGLAEASAKIQSNLYNWEGSMSGGNNTVDIPRYFAQYKAMAHSPIHLLSYKLEGAGMILGKSEDNLKYLLNCSFNHILLDTSFSILETLRVTEKLNAQANYKLEALSPLGLESSLYYFAHSTSTLNSDEVSGEGSLAGIIKIASFPINTSYSQSYSLRPLDREGKGESILHFDSPYIQFKNVIRGVYANSELNVISKTSTQREVFRHVAELKYKDAQLTLKCNTVGLVLGKSLNNIVEFGVSNHMSIIRIESQAGDDTSRVYSLLTGSLVSNRLEVNSEALVTFDIGRALHKASIRATQDGLTFSGINNIQCSPVTIENNFDGAIDVNGALFSSTTKGMAEEGRGELSIEGKITPSEASLSGDFKGHAYDAVTANNMNVLVNRRGLTLSGNTKGTLRQMTMENNHELTLTLWTLSLHSKTNNFICEDLYYKQNIKVDVKPFVIRFHMTNNLRFYDLVLHKEGHMRFDPLEVYIRGTLSGAFRENNIKHIYELTYKDLSGSLKHSTSGNMLDSQLSHSCELEFAGFSSKSKCEAKLNSEPLNFGGNLHIQALPFSLDIDLSLDGDGKINIHGKHSGQLFSSLLVKTTPLALAWSYDSRVSTTHLLPNGESSSSFSNKFEGMITPKDQSLDWKVNSKLNNNAFEQRISAYNNPEKIGLEILGVALTDLLNSHKRSKPEAQSFSMSGFLKYDKNSDCHIVEIPFFESFPAAFEHLKMTFVEALESLQKLIENLEINQILTDFRNNLDQLPIQVRNFMRKLDLEEKIDKIKGRLDYWFNDFSVTMDDLEVSVRNMRYILEKNILNLVRKVHDFITRADEYINAGHLSEKITAVFSDIGDQLRGFIAKHEIRESLVRMLDFIEDIIRQMDLKKLKQSSAAFLYEFDLKYGILMSIKEKLSELKAILKDSNLSQFVEGMKNYLLSIDWVSYVEQLSFEIPVSEIERVMESMNEVIVNWIDEYEIPNKLSAVYFYCKDLLLKYEFDDIFNDLMDQAVILVRELKIEETVQTIVEALKSIKLEQVYDKMIQYLYSITDKIREIDLKKSIDDLNERISSVVESMKHFDYNSFVDEMNIKIIELTNYLNQEIKRYEIVNKIEAVRKFFREIQSSIYTYLDELKKTKVADTLKKLMDVIDTAFYNDLKLKFQDILEDMRQRILEMDIRDEILMYLRRASDSYKNVVALISSHFNQLMEWIETLASDYKDIEQMNHAVREVLEQIKTAEIEVPSFTVPFTNMVLQGFKININKLQEITIPAKIPVPDITILGSYTVPAFTLDFNEIKAKVLAIIDGIREIQIQIPDLEDIFGNLKVIYLSELPDFTFPAMVLTEIKFPPITIPKLNRQDSEMRMLTIPDVAFPWIPVDICIPLFGKLHGEFSLFSPKYVLVNKFKLENSTPDSSNPKFKTTFTSQATSPIKFLEHSVQAVTQLEAHRMENLQFSQTFKATHVSFSVHHEACLTLPGSHAVSSAKFTTTITTPVYTADLFGRVELLLESGVSVVIETSYNHTLDIPTLKAYSQISLTQNVKAIIDRGAVTVTGETGSTGKWSFQDFSDEGTHRTNIGLKVDVSTAKLMCAGELDYKAFKSKHTLTAESAILGHIAVIAQCDSETPFLKNSVMALSGEADVADLKTSFMLSHEAELSGDLTGTLSNSWEFKAHPFEVVVNVKNKMNSKVLLPLKLTSKVDLQHDYGLLINSGKQSACWFALARFNQYKYSHNLTAENNERNIYFQSTAEGEANLEFLTIPVSVPEMTIPYLQIQTPPVRDFSLWVDGGLKSWLLNHKQSFDLDLEFQYHKNPDLRHLELDLEPIYSAISKNFEIIQSQFEACRDKVLTLLKDSYHEARAQYIKHEINTSNLSPKIFTVPGYKVPLLGIQVSAFRAEMPAFSYFVPKEVSTASFRVPALGFSVPSYTLVLPSLSFPVIHVPESLSEIKLPTFTLPAAQDQIVIPVMGNITCNFSLKSNVITLNANAGVYNESGIVARFGAVSVSVFDVLNGKMDGTTNLTGMRGLKLASAVTLEHSSVKANHHCSVSVTKRNIEYSAANFFKINLPFLQMEISQEFSGNTRTKLHVVSKKKLSYMFNVPQVASTGRGSIDMSWDLEALFSQVLLEYSSTAKSDIMIWDMFNIAGYVENKKNVDIRITGLRTTDQTNLSLQIDLQEKQKRSMSSNLFSFDLENTVASDVSVRRVFATVKCESKNNAQIEPFTMSGKHAVWGELDLVPLKTFKTKLKCEADHSSSLGDAGLIQEMNIIIGYERQAFSWSLNERLGSVFHGSDWDVFNKESERGIVFSGSVGGQLAFLKSIRLPVYQRTLWDVLKFNEVSNINDVQFFNISSAVVYTKSMDGYDYQLPAHLLVDGVTFSLPGFSIVVPSWLKEIPDSIRSIDMRFENVEVPDQVYLPPVVLVPAFHVPFTNLYTESFTVDPKSLKILNVITTKAFDIMLPSLPIISLPSVDVNAEYLQAKMSFLSFKVPQFDIILSSFTLPTSITIGDLTISLDDLTSHILHLKIPTIVIPEQKVEIPEVNLHLPSSIFIPSFGALSATFNFSFPVYKVSTTGSVSNRNPNLEVSVSSTCVSTMVFMEYDLTVSEAIRYEDEIFRLYGNGRWSHKDVNVNWQHVLEHPLRIKRQISRGDSVTRESHHTLDVDITSRMFTDASVRFAGHKDSITASVSSPSVGFLGMHLQQRSSSQLQGKVFSRFLITPEKDTMVLNAKASMKNADKLVLQTSWNWDGVNALVTGFKDRIPQMTNALLKFVNKYHSLHFGFDLSRGSAKLRNAVLTVIEKVCQEVQASLSSIHNLVQAAADRGKDTYTLASDFKDMMNLTDMLMEKVRLGLKYTQDSTDLLLEPARDFLNKNNFSVPGSERTLPILEVLSSFMEMTSEQIQKMAFTIPGTEVVVDGGKIMKTLQTKVAAAAHWTMDIFQRSLRHILVVLAERAEQLHLYFQDQNLKVSALVREAHTIIRTSSRRHSDQAVRLISEYKHLLQLKVHEAYNGVTRERVNSATRGLISVLQSNLSESVSVSLDVMRTVSAPYVRVGREKVDVEVPLPVLWKSFSEWPTLLEP